MQGYAKLYGIWLPRRALWAEEVRKELLQFPTGKHDDVVDCFSLVGRALEAIRRGKPPPEPPGPGRITMDAVLEEHERNLREIYGL